MSGAEGAVRQRPPWLFGAIAILIGVGLAVTAGVLLSGTGPTASTTPGVTSSASFELPSALPSPSEVAAASLPPDVTAAPTSAPTSGPTAGPTAKPTAKPTATPNTNPAIITWKVPAREDCTNSTQGSIHVEWTVARATGVTISIDGPGIYNAYPGTSGSVDLPYGCSIAVLAHTYTLRTTGGVGPAATSTKTVTTREGEIVTFTMPNEANCPGTSGSVAVSLVYEIIAANGVQLYRGTELYANYVGKTSSNGLMVPYDCSKDKVVFHLVTDGGYGAVDEDTETITRVITPP